jgi:hypothetical protein
MADHDPSLEAIMRSDRFVDALADGARMSAVDPLSAMLGAWRDDVRSRPDDRVVTLAQASAALAKAQKPSRGNKVGLAIVGGVAAALLALGGFLTIGDGLFQGSTTQTRTESVALAAQTELAEVQKLVDEGKWDEAEKKLVNLGPTVESVPDLQSRQELTQRYNQLAVQVVERDPEATLPPAGQPLPELAESPLTFLAPVTEVIVPTTGPSVLIAPVPSATEPLPTPTGPLPTPTGPLPTPTGPLPTPTGPLPTPTAPAPTAPAPTPTAPAPTAPAPKPTPTVTKEPTVEVPTAPPSSPAVQAPPVSPNPPAASPNPPAAEPSPEAAPPSAAASPESPKPTPTSSAPRGPAVR